MISYCIAAYRHRYAAALIEELHKKTSVPYETLVWVNGPGEGLLSFVESKKGEGVPVKVVGYSPDNVGMNSYRDLFLSATHDLIVQIDDDVLLVSREIAQIAADIFKRHPKVKQLVADVWQDEFTTGARPNISSYLSVSDQDGLMDGPIDGWFSIYHRSIMPMLLDAPYEKYFYLGSFVREKLRISGLQGLLCQRMKVFHACGPIYAKVFGYLDVEIEKYKSLGNEGILKAYRSVQNKELDMKKVARRLADVQAILENFKG